MISRAQCSSMSRFCKFHPFFPKISTLRYTKTFFRGARFFQSNARTPSKHQSRVQQRKRRPPIKSIQNQNADRKEYMRDVISNIYKILKYSTWDSAQQGLRKLDIKWDSYTVNQVLKSHPPMEKAWLFFNWASNLKGFKHDQFTYTTMMDIFGEAGRISSMKFVFEQMKEKGMKVDAVTYTSLMHWLSNSGDVEGAIKMWEDMREHGFCLTVVSYTAYMKILFDNNRVKEASDVYKEMLESGCTPNCHTYTILMEYLIRAGKCKEALDIFFKMQEAGVQPDKAACNILVEKCCQGGDTGTIMQILQYMKDNRLVLRYPIFMEALKTLEAANISDTLLRQVNPHFYFESCNKKEAADANVSSDGVLALVLSKKQNLITLNHFLVGITEKNIQLDHKIIAVILEVNCRCCRADSALLAFEYGVKRGFKFERNVYLALIGTMIRSNAFTKILEIVKEMINAGHSLGTYMGALLLYKLGRARRPTCAAKIFNLLSTDERNTATYTAMIGVYFSAGSADKALEIYRMMQRKGIQPVVGTYNVLIAGLEKSGRTSGADTYRKEKKSLQSSVHSVNIVQMEGRISNLLFAGAIMS